MNWDEVREMSRDGIGFGSHTHGHRILPELDDAEIEFELGVSRRLIEEQLGSPVHSFSYPDGRVDERSISHVERAGYRYAVQTYRSSRAPLGLFDIPRRKVKELHSAGPCGGFSKSLFHLEMTGMGDRLFRRRT
jgi:peptidoglycan/xylan/chitin deacetylase (PgdA/CDA1 family)